MMIATVSSIMRSLSESPLHARRARSSPLLVAVLLASLASCSPPPSPPPLPPLVTTGAYDFRSPSYVSGTVLTIDDVRATDAAFSGVMVVLSAEHGTLAVSLGPKKILDEYGVSLAPGDALEVRGIPAVFQGRPTLVATSISKQSRELALPARSLPQARDAGQQP